MKIETHDGRIIDATEINEHRGQVRCFVLVDPKAELPAFTPTRTHPGLSAEAHRGRRAY